MPNSVAMTTPQSPVFRILRLLKVTGCPAGSRWAWNAGGPSSAHSSRGAAAGKGKATLDVGPNEVRTEQPCAMSLGGSPCDCVLMSVYVIGDG